MDQIDSRVEVKVRQTEQKFASAQIPDSSLGFTSAVIPSEPAHFCGRDTTVNEIVQHIVSSDLSKSPPRIGITGAGGIGKTSVAQAVAGRADIVKQFGSRRSWVRCDETTSLVLFIDRMAVALQVTRSSSNDLLRDITSTLLCNPNPHFLLLDNFETLWDIIDQREKIGNVLRTIAAIPHLTILMTKRGALPAIESIHWSDPEGIHLDGLSPDAALHLYKSIYPLAIKDESLEALLEALNYMPLAVVLMARVGKYGNTPTELLNRWKSEGTALVDEPGGDRSQSIGRSITLSLDSNVVKADPDARRLLSALAILPAGVQMKSLSAIVPSVSNPRRAQATLLKTSLAYIGPDGESLRVLSPIRAVFQHDNPLIPEILRELQSFYFRLLRGRNCHRDNNPKWLENVNTLSKEELNIEAVLLGAFQSGGSESGVEAAVQFSSLLLERCPRTEVLEAAVDWARTQENSSTSLPSALRALGKLKIAQHRYVEGGDHLEEAREKFLELNQRGRLGAALCLMALGDLDLEQDRYSDARRNLQNARQQFSELDDLYNAASCFQYLGRVEFADGNYDEARGYFGAARDEFHKSGAAADRDAIGCLGEIGDVHESQGNHEAARSAYEDALRECQDRRDDVEAARNRGLLGELQFLHGLDVEARKNLEAARHELLHVGHLEQAADCLRVLGIIDQKEGHYDDAFNALNTARRGYKEVGALSKAASCLFNVGDLELELGNYEDAGRAFRAAYREFQNLATGQRVNGAWCLQRLGEVEWIQGQYKEARDTYRKARQEFEAAGDSEGQMFCFAGGRGV